MSSESVSSEDENDDTESLISSFSRSKIMEARLEHQTYKRYKVLYSIATFCGVVAITLIFVWMAHYKNGFSWSNDRSLQFNWHPVLMTFGLVFLYGQSMLIYRTGRFRTKYSLKLAHAIIHMVAFICCVIGLVAVFQNHNYAPTPRPNLYTSHSWIGLSCVILFGIQWAAGFLIYLLPWATMDIRKMTMPIHVATGTCLFVGSIIAAFMGIAEKAAWSIDKYDTLPSEAVLVNFASIAMCLYGVLTLYLVSTADYKRAVLPEEHITLSSTSSK